jgi:DNA-binding IclR family transcriptional regulator
MKNGERQQQVFDVFDELPRGSELSASDIASKLKMQRQAIASTLRTMVKNKKLRRRTERARHPAFGEQRMHGGKTVLYRLPLVGEQ